MGGREKLWACGVFQREKWEGDGLIAFYVCIKTSWTTLPLYPTHGKSLTKGKIVTSMKKELLPNTHHIKPA